MNFVTTHLEVRNTPDCRAKQMEAIVTALREANAPRPTIIAGDFNSNTFARGGMLRTFSGFARLMFSEPDKLRQAIAAPQAREPLFALLEKLGFTDKSFNSSDVTCYVPLKILEDSSKLPGFLTTAIARQIARYNGQLDFRLDWLIGRCVKALGDGEMIDTASQCASRKPQTISGLRNEMGGQITDHDPITVDLRLAY